MFISLHKYSHLVGNYLHNMQLILFENCDNELCFY